MNFDNLALKSWVVFNSESNEASMYLQMKNYVARHMVWLVVWDQSPPNIVTKKEKISLQSSRREKFCTFVIVVVMFHPPLYYKHAWRNTVISQCLPAAVPGWYSINSHNTHLPGDRWRPCDELYEVMRCILEVVYLSTQNKKQSKSN